MVQSFIWHHWPATCSWSEIHMDLGVLDLVKQVDIILPCSRLLIFSSSVGSEDNELLQWSVIGMLYGICIACSCDSSCYNIKEVANFWTFQRPHLCGLWPFFNCHLDYWDGEPGVVCITCTFFVFICCWGEARNHIAQWAGCIFSWRARNMQPI